MPAAHAPDSQRHAGERKEEGTQQRSASQPGDLLCSPGKRALFPGAAPQTSDLPPGSGSPLGHGRCKEAPISLQAAEQRRSSPSQRLRCRHCTRPWTLLGNPAGSWMQLQLECDTECWEGTELYSWAHYSPAMSHAAKLCCRGWYCSVSNLCHSCPSIGAQLQGETR